MARYVHGSDPNDPFQDNPFNPRVVQEGYDMRRGKVAPRPRAAWGMKGGMGQDVDHDAGQKVLDEALRG